jgi:sulfur-carrier protein
MKLEVLYFGILAEQRGLNAEIIHTDAGNACELYEELALKHHFTLLPSQLQVAIDHAFSAFTIPLEDGQCVAFLPPMAGG